MSYTKFNDITIQTKFIKQLVANTNVPFISTWKPGDFAIRGMMYITRDALWRCNHTGFPQHINDTCKISTNQLYGNNVRYDGGKSGNHSEDQVEIPYFTKISPYVFGEEYYNITGKYTSKISGYDATTHFYLGQYLRMMRDLFDLDLMPLYNCYCGETIQDIDFNESGVSVEPLNPFYKMISIPVRFGKTYTIAIDSQLPIEMATIVYGQKGLIIDKTSNLNDIEDANVVGGVSTYRRFNHTSFTRPFIYNTKSWHQLYKAYTISNYGKITNVNEGDDYQIINNNAYDQGIGQYEKYLRLVIKIPSTNKSSIVVLEGDYGVGQLTQSNNTNNVTFTNQTMDDLTINSRTISGDWVRPTFIRNFEYDSEGVESSEYYQTKSPMISPLGLLQLNDTNTYAFSDRLIEYLLQNVINPLEEFGKNIERVQKYISSNTHQIKNNSRYMKNYTNGVWDDDIREFLFKISRDTIYLDKKIDLLGYVDKDVEQIVSRGQEV